MLSIGVKSDLDRFKSFNRQMAAQVAFASSLALNRTAEHARGALRSTMSRVFDRPTPFTLNSLFIKPATKTNLVARVGHKDKSAVNKYLKAEIEGGQRELKGFERVFERLGGSGFLVPTDNVRKNSYGNLSRAQVQKIVAAASSSNGSDPRAIFVVPMGAKSHLAPGIYQRVPVRTRVRGGRVTGGGGSKVKTLMLFKTATRYRPIYDLKGVVERTVQSEFSRQFAAAMDYALSTARIRLNI
jgi:hypothetical protein